jgi:hypothetical protein
MNCPRKDSVTLPESRHIKKKSTARLEGRGNFILAYMGRDSAS